VGYIEVVEGHLAFILAKNKGGAWGLLQGATENLRRPFFLLVSVAAIWFIMTLYRKLHPRQHALRWGLPLVLGGALGNVVDRIRYGYVIDFIDYHSEWVRSMNEWVKKYVHDHLVTDHWPTFNIADVAICVGVGLMAVDMFFSPKARVLVPPAEPIEGAGIVDIAQTAAPGAAAGAAAAAPSE
jgi:signal peptidase II